MNYLTIAAASKAIPANVLAGASTVFDKIEEGTRCWAEQLGKLGLADRKAARPIAVLWAAKKYSEKLVDGERGVTFAARDTAASKAVQRVLDAVYGGADMSKVGNANADPVAKLVKAYGKLSAGEKRSFKAQLAKL